MIVDAAAKDGSPERVEKHAATRYLTSLFANAIRALIAGVTGILVARGLGAAKYGDLNFLLSTFAAFTVVLDLGTSHAFYTFLARRPQSRRFFQFYFAWVTIQALVSVLALALVLPSDWLRFVWFGQSRGVLVLAFAASFATNQLWVSVTRMGESARETRKVQIDTVARVVLHLVLVTTALVLHRLSVVLVLVFLVVEYGLGAIQLASRMFPLTLDHSAAQESWQEWVGMFWDFCRPLVFFECFSFFYTFADRWLLQRFGGSTQQGFFSLAQQFANVALLATQSVLNVFWKEVAEARAQGDHARTERLLHSVTTSMYFLGAWACALAIPYTRLILVHTAGAAFQGAVVCFAVMLLLPVHQPLGLIQGAFFMAVGEAKTWVTVSAVSMVASLPLTYFLLAPPTASVPGLGAGALGLAVKLIVLQIVVANIQGYILAKQNGWPYQFGYQFAVLGLLAVAWASKGLAEAGAKMLHLEPGIVVAVAGVALYAVVTLASAWRFPRWFGLDASYVLRLKRILADANHAWAS